MCIIASWLWVSSSFFIILFLAREAVSLREVVVRVASKPRAWPDSSLNYYATSFVTLRRVYIRQAGVLLKRKSWAIASKGGSTIEVRALTLKTSLMRACIDGNHQRQQFVPVTCQFSLTRLSLQLI
jgi:hypothetical protein